MTIQRGTKSYKRGNARNYSHREAQRRLDETVKPFNRQVENSLFVNAVEIDYYQVMDKMGKPCTCEKIELQDGEGNIVSRNPDSGELAPIIPTDDQTNEGVEIRFQDDDVFGDSSAEKLYGAVTVDINDMPRELSEDLDSIGNDSYYEEGSMFGNNVNCGICYRTGFQPGYKSYGKQRMLLTTWDVDQISGYAIDTSETPNTIVRQGPVGPDIYVDFVITVPKYFTNCIYSIRHDTVITNDKIMCDGQPLSMSILKRYAGKDLFLTILAKEFTHVVLEFDLGAPRVRANIGAESQMLDYTKLEALSNFPVVLPPSVHTVNVSDIICVPSRRLVLKITDKERKITADKRQIEWSVQTRVVQKTEPLKLISKGFKVI